MEQTLIRIPARSRRQAMDWSLVLASQGIECIIDRSEAAQGQASSLSPEPRSADGWGLLVAQNDHASALKAISQYRLENRNWPWQQRMLQPGILFDWGSLAWTFLIVFFFWLDTRIGLHAAGVMDTTAAAHGQWWRLFTAVWLHGDAAHLAANATVGLVLLGLAMGRYGTGAGLLAAYLAGAGGNALGWLLSEAPHLSLGASGMVMGSLGLIAIQSLSLLRQKVAPGTANTGAPASLSASSYRLQRAGKDGATPLPNNAVSVSTPPSSAARYLVGGILGGVMLFVLLGLSPGTDIVAHAGGFMSGLVIGGILTLAHVRSQMSLINMLCGFVFVLLVIVPWWLALASF